MRALPLFAIVTLLLWPVANVRADSPGLSVEAAFSPDEGAEALVLKAIARANATIRIAAYSFTSKPVAEALVAAHRRGVLVEAVLDQSQQGERYTGATFLAHAGIAVRIDRRHAIMHDKFLVVDDLHVQTGSFNYTRAAAQRNAENVLVIWNDPALARAYADNWREHWSHASPWGGGD